MRILQPAEWSKPRGFSHGVEVDGPGKWIVLAGQTGGDEKGDYAPDMAAQVGTALKRIIKLLGEAGAGPEHIVRLTWYLTSRSEYEAAGPGIGQQLHDPLQRRANLGAHVGRIVALLVTAGLAGQHDPSARPVDLDAM